MSVCLFQHIMTGNLDGYLQRPALCPAGCDRRRPVRLHSQGRHTLTSVEREPKMRLLEPIKIGGVELKNRVVMPAMFVNLGLRSRRARAFYVERARGGVAAIIMVGTSVDLFFSDEAWGKQGGVAGFIEGLRSLNSEVQKAGARMGIQLFHPSRFPAGTGLEDTRGEPVAPSPMDDIRYKGGNSGIGAKVPCRELTTGEVEAIIARFGSAARGVKDAGFDFVEINAAHGHFASQFFSPLDNRRKDRFGGDMRSRMTFGLECVKAMRSAVGDGFPIVYRIGGPDEMPGGVTLADNVAFAVELEKVGVDVFNVSVGAPADPRSYFAGFLTPTPDRPLALFADWAAAFKQNVKTPVMVVGRINTPEVAEQIISEGKTDLVAVGRQLLSDPHWTRKVAGGKREEIVPCLSCNTCMASVAAGEIRCAVNPVLGRETEYVIARTDSPRKVLVIGGGPAGMEAARVAALRGHDVTLWEKEKVLGGQLKVAALPPNKKEIGMFNAALSLLAERAGVKVKLGQDAMSDAVLNAKPDSVVVASGATPIVPANIPGIRGRNVVTALDVLGSPSLAGKRVAVIGGGLIGCETAEFLAGQGKRVTLLEMQDEMACDMAPLLRRPLLGRLAKLGVSMEVRTRVTEVVEDGVNAEQGGVKRWFETDTVVLAAGMAPDKRLAAGLQGKVRELHVIGDCETPRKIVDAMADGARVGFAL